ncbi:MAG: rhodanese [Alteromonas sp.]|nr:rhodanese [Alteromonas sp.]MAY21643.1 rhodanese [Flavobacteriaceae bacterium]|tara:strand:+ start:31036 stop:31533 length:498 start_codon:yes stop_codon:yes gene_type:complete
MKLLGNIALLLFFGTSFAQKPLEALLKAYNQRSIPYISVTEARMHQLNGDALILDAREKEEFEVSKIPSAMYIGSQQFSEKRLQKTIQDKDQEIIVYCSIGIRSEKISEKIKKLGYTHVKNLYGGIFEWKNEGFPVVDSLGKETEKVHTYSEKWAPYLTKGIKVH